jgi:hypothetical protein
MRHLFAVIAFAGLVLGSTGCPHKIHGAITSDERKIWVITTDFNGNQEVYRCGDTSGPDQPPNPMCRHAPLTPNP